MNKFIISCSAIFITILFASCSSTQKITVNGKPNTSIYNTKYEYLGKIQSDGKTKIKLKRKNMKPFCFHRKRVLTYIYHLL